MSQVPEVTASIAASAPDSEKIAISRGFPRTTSSGPTPASAPKLRSCQICRSRKVRCDKQSPCSNCWRANIACVYPSTADRPPRWARRVERLTKKASAAGSPLPQDADSVDKVMDRLRKLESLVKELSGQLEQARAAAGSAGGGSSGFNSPGRPTQDRDAEHQTDTSPASTTSSVQKQFGRLVVQDASHSRYVSSGFWSRINDELDGLKMDTRDLAGDESDSSEDEASPAQFSTRELDRTPSKRHAFLFGHNLSSSNPDLRELHPLPSQIPFLIETFSDNVNFVIQIVHIPTVVKLVRDLRGDMTRLTPANEALMFSIYYAAVTSMEEDDIITNFGASKSDLNLKYRLGLEHALAKADFLNAPDIVLVQAITIFLCLARRHDSPRFVWMMTGLVIRMAQYLGLQRDGAHFEHLTPFEIEMRRRVWWSLCNLDLRASDDQGTDLTITSGSFDTKLPLNINDTDMNPESKQVLIEREGLTDMSLALIFFGSGDIVMQMTAASAKDGPAGLEDQSRLLNELYQKYEHGYLQYATESGTMTYWLTVTVARLVMAKMTLLTFLPVLFSSQNERLSDEIRTRLLVSAIEVAEYNHALNAEHAARQWRWIFQTYTHWHAIVYLMIEISRRPWSPIVERAWVALHSSWLIPAQAPMDKNLRMWVPLRKLMTKARKHRDTELHRLRADRQAAMRLDVEDQKIPLPASSGQLPSGASVDIFRERWRKLVFLLEGGGDGTPAPSSGAEPAGTWSHATGTSPPGAGPVSAYSPGDFSSNMAFGPTSFGPNAQQASQTLAPTNIRNPEPATKTSASTESALGQTVELSYNPSPAVPTDWSDGRTMGPDFVPWLWADATPSADDFPNLNVDSIDVNMDLDSEMNWYNWVESAKGMDWDARPT